MFKTVITPIFTHKTVYHFVSLNFDGKNSLAIDFIGGGYRNRTGVHGFAIRCITTLPTRPGSTWTWATSLQCVVTLKLDGMQEAGTVIQSDCRGIFFAKGRVLVSLSEKLPFNRMGCILFSPIIWENRQRLFHFSVCASSLDQFALGWPLVRNFLMIFRITD